jgi:alpha-methylacyl-CoA racemase
MGPLDGVKVIEVGGLAPGPFCGMLLSDMGADVVRIERTDQLMLTDPKFDVLKRNRRSVVLDLRAPQAVEALLRMVEQVDAIHEGFRPGVMERLGLGPEVCLKRNPRLVYGRMTGWGQEGPLALAAGHDINYISLTGTLHTIGRKGERPVPPLNLIGDFGGGGMLLAFGMVCALFEARRSGQGQVVDAAMIDGAAAQTAMIYGFRASGIWTDEREDNLLDGAAHFYDTYETADGKYVSVGSIEPQFYALLLKHTGIEDPEFQNQLDKARWPALKARVAEVFRSKTRDEWCRIMEGTDVCFAPVLSLDEARDHPHNRHRKTFIEVEGVAQGAPAPRFSRTVPATPKPPPRIGQHTEEVLADFGFRSDEIRALREAKVI